jgi:hypothetical protein
MAYENEMKYNEISGYRRNESWRNIIEKRQWANQPEANNGGYQLIVQW